MSVPVNLAPVGFRTNGRLIRCTKHTALEVEPIMRSGEWMGSFREPDKIVGMKIIVSGIKSDPDNGRCEWWTPRDEGGYWYFHYANVEWQGQFGTADLSREGNCGFMAVEKRLQGLREFKKMVREWTRP